MKNSIIILSLIFLVSCVVSQDIKIADLTPTGLHEWCLYTASGISRGCYNDTIDFDSGLLASDTTAPNRVYYIKAVPKVYDMGFSGTNIISYLVSLIPFVLFIGIIGLIIGLILVVMFLLVWRRR
jgi:hypothetical protein